MEMKRKRKKSRPSKTSIPSKPSTSSRSSHRNPNFDNFDESCDDDDERKQKKIKLVVRLPQSDEKISQKNQSYAPKNSSEYDSSSALGCDSDPDSENHETNAREREINAADDGFNDVVSDQEKKFVKGTENSNGSQMGGIVLTTPLPDKKLLAFILQRLQKKDSRGAFSEPVDPDELPDYHEIIEQPMDFGTVNKKLDNGSYKSLEELEADVLLICSNAMKYNPSDSIYYRQARSIQELAMRDFGNLRHEGDDGQPQPKVVRRGRPPGKNQKKVLEISPIHRVAPEVPSGATLATEECKAAGSSSYNLRKAPPLSSFHSPDLYISSYRPRNGENPLELSINWNDEFPASILRADMKYGKKLSTVDENRRDTYGQFHPLSYVDEPHVLSNSTGEPKQLVPVGLQEPLAYARSLSKYAVNLGPVAWKIVSKKIESIIPSGIQYGPGWVGENGGSLKPPTFSSEKQKSSSGSAGDCNSRNITTPSTSDLSSTVACEGMLEAVKKLNSQNELPVQGDASSWRMQFQAHPKPLYQPHINGSSGVFGYNLSSGGMPGISTTPFIPQMPETGSINDLLSGHSTINRVAPEEAKFPESWGTLQSGGRPITQGKPSWQWQQRHNHSVPPDLNMQVATVSPSSSIQIGSPQQQQPDLALQL